MYSRVEMEPVFLLQLHTAAPKATHVLTTDYGTLKHLCDELDVALKDLKSAHARRIQRNIK
jgi:hypothetical protein